METVLIDTSVIVRYLKTADGILADILGHYKLLISVVTLTELLASNRASDQNTNRQIRDFLSDNFEVLPVTPEVAGKTGDVLREVRSINLAAATVAATAIDKDVPLLTYDLKTFDQVPDLKLVDV